jgi:altronate dehydratase small subunit
MKASRETVILINPNDNVATARKDLAQGTACRAGKAKVRLRQRIPLGHKVALRPIQKGEAVIKFGDSIGLATSDIAPGDLVHIHNMESCRGRGDKAK